MAAAVKKRLRIFAGPNGSGKSTITKIVLDYGDRNLSPVIVRGLTRELKYKN